jgi:hypothetical protein
MKTNFTYFLARCVTATAFCVCALTIQAADESPSVAAILEKASRSSQLTPQLEEIVKLTKARVPDVVTLAYIQSSPTPYSLDAQDILRLNEQGVSSQVVTAMMQHGDELRRAAAEAGNQAQTVATAPTSQSPAPVATTPAPTVVESAPVAAAPASTVSVTYFGSRPYSYYPSYACYGPGLGYYYPAYYSYAPRYYGYCGPRVSFGVGFGYRGGYYGGYARCR